MGFIVPPNPGVAKASLPGRSLKSGVSCINRGSHVGVQPIRCFIRVSAVVRSGVSEINSCATIRYFETSPKSVPAP